LFELVAAAFENQLQGGKGYHIELRRRMTIAVDGVRPRAISDRTLKALDSLRGFRHVFCHAYSGGLDPRKIAIVVEHAREVREALAAEVQEFIATVASADVLTVAPRRTPAHARRMLGDDVRRVRRRRSSRWTGAAYRRCRHLTGCRACATMASAENGCA